MEVTKGWDISGFSLSCVFLPYVGDVLMFVTHVPI